MSAQWTGAVVGEMHIAKVSMKQLAAEIGWHEKYLSAVMNGHREPKDAETKVRAALSRLTGSPPDDHSVSETESE